MASQVRDLISEECRVAINQVASYELHVSDAYLSMVSMSTWATEGGFCFDTGDDISSVSLVMMVMALFVV